MQLKATQQSCDKCVVIGSNTGQGNRTAQGSRHDAAYDADGRLRASQQRRPEPARQLEAVGPVDRVIEEKVSGGSRADRTALAECIRYVRDGDNVRVSSMDRLARSLRDLRDIVDEISTKGASVTFVEEQQTYGADTGDAIGQLMLNLLGAFAQFERSLLERQSEGIRLAREAGKYLGRAPKLTTEQIYEARDLIDADIPKTVVAQKLGVNRTTLYPAIGPSVA